MTLESEFDGIVVYQEASDLINVAIIGNTTVKPDIEIFKNLQNTDVILNAIDFDKPGAKASIFWNENFNQVKRWPVPEGKDPGEYFKDHGGNIRKWIIAGLPPIFKMENKTI